MYFLTHFSKVRNEGLIVFLKALKLSIIELKCNLLCLHPNTFDNLVRLKMIVNLRTLTEKLFGYYYTSSFSSFNK